jgi:hypothetical protein
MPNVNVRESLCAPIYNEHYTHNKIFDTHTQGSCLIQKNKNNETGTLSSFYNTHNTLGFAICWLLFSQIRITSVLLWSIFYFIIT